MSETIYESDFTKYLPQALASDIKMVALAKAITDELLTVSKEMKNVLIYARIDDLPEELVDVLAYDLHVDWYDYSYPLAAKRDLLKSSIKVHKKMGTKYAVEKALSALYPESEVEEWFQYEGEPGHFHIVCDVTNSRITASFSDIVRAVKMYKRLSAHFDEVVYQSHIHCEIHTHTDVFLYHAPTTGKLHTGTYPQRNIKGVNYGRNIVVGTEAAGFIFVNPAAGTIPERNTEFHGRIARIDAETALNAFRYRNIPAGQINAGESPQRVYRGGNAGAVMEAAGETAAYRFTSQAAGTDPERSTVFHHQQAQIDAETASNAYGYRNTPTGQINAGESPQRSHRGGSAGAAVEVEGETAAHTFTSPAAGTVPERSTAQRTEGGAVESTAHAAGFSYTVKQCGSSRKL